MVRRTDEVRFRASSLADWLTARLGAGESSGLLAKRHLDRYQWLLAASMPSFTREEALAVADACNGVLYPDPEHVTLLPDAVEDSPGLGERWGIDQAALVARLRELTPAEKLAVVDAVEQAWQIGDVEDALVNIGLIAPEWMRRARGHS